MPGSAPFPENAVFGRYLIFTMSVHDISEILKLEYFIHLESYLQRRRWKASMDLKKVNWLMMW